MEIVDRLLGGDQRALARAISLVESRADEAREVLRALFPRTGGAQVIGITGFPGGGKSSLADRLTAHYRGQGKSVGVLAVDPSSAFSGGAILGDRIRMQRHSADPGVFIRSMATRGALGGLSKAAFDAVDILDGSGREVILLETVGVGQDEVDVVRVAGGVLVVLVPGLGDDIQAIKAGILEIADIFVINKADREGADRLQSELEAMLGMVRWDGEGEAGRPEIVRTVAVRDEGTVELAEAIARRLGHGGARSVRRRREQCASRFLELLRDRLLDRTLDACLKEAELEGLVGGIAERLTDPYSAVEEVIGRIRFGES
jgi:LAO/AO transport system kinase